MKLDGVEGDLGRAEGVFEVLCLDHVSACSRCPPRGGRLRRPAARPSYPDVVATDLRRAVSPSAFPDADTSDLCFSYTPSCSSPRARQSLVRMFAMPGSPGWSQRARSTSRGSPSLSCRWSLKDRTHRSSLRSEALPGSSRSSGDLPFVQVGASSRIISPCQPAVSQVRIADWPRRT